MKIFDWAERLSISCLPKSYSFWICCSVLPVPMVITTLYLPWALEMIWTDILPERFFNFLKNTPEISHATPKNENYRPISAIETHFKKCAENRKKVPELLLIDGNRFRPYKQVPYHCIIKGDGIFRSIAAASILAKTYRDDFMLGLDQHYPEYLWNKNKGYPTREHRKAIKEHGISPFHRKTFRLTDDQLEIPF